MPRTSADRARSPQTCPGRPLGSPRIAGRTAQSRITLTRDPNNLSRVNYVYNIMYNNIIHINILVNLRVFSGIF